MLNKITRRAVSLSLALIIALSGAAFSPVTASAAASPTVQILTDAIYAEVGTFSDGLIGVRSDSTTIQVAGTKYDDNWEVIETKQVDVPAVHYLDADGKFVCAVPVQIINWNPIDGAYIKDYHSGYVSYPYGHVEYGVEYAYVDGGIFDKKGELLPLANSFDHGEFGGVYDGYLTGNEIGIVMIIKLDGTSIYWPQKLSDPAITTNIISEGLAAAAVNGKTDEEWNYVGPFGFVDLYGKWVIQPTFEQVRSFNQGLAPAKQNGKWGFIDKAGKWVTQPQYDDFWITDSYAYTLFNDGLACVQKNGKWGAVDKSGNVAVPFNFGKGFIFANGFAVAEKDGKSGYMDKTGKWAIQPQFDDANYFSGGGFALVGTGGTYKLIDKSGKDVGSETWQFESTRLANPASNVFAYKKGGKWGIAKIVTNETAQPEASELTVTDAEVGVLVSWTGAADASGYRVYRSEKQGERGELVYEGGAQPTEFVDVTAKSNSKYFYTVVKLTGDAKTETPMTFDKGTGAVATEEIRGSEREGKKGYLLMKVDSPTMSVNGVVTEIDPGRGTAPKNVDGRVLMPIRAAIEAMGGTADWAQADKKVTLSVGKTVIEMRIGEKTFTVNGAAKTLDVPAQTINDRTMLPIRFVAENIGCEIAWVGSTKEVVVVFWQD